MTDNIGAMVTSLTPPNLNDPTDLLLYLSKPLRAARDGLDHGVSYAATVVTDRQSDDDYYWAHAARWQARRYLAGLSPDGWELGRKLPNTGIELLCGPVVLRVLRRYQDGPPNPGTSRARKGFYSQYTPEAVLGLEWPDGVQLPDSCNLIVDWAVGANKQVSLALSKPVGVWKFKGQPKLDWRRLVAFDPNDEPRFETLDDEFEIPRYDEAEMDTYEGTG